MSGLNQAPGGAFAETGRWGLQVAQEVGEKCLQTPKERCQTGGLTCLAHREAGDADRTSPPWEAVCSEGLTLNIPR